MDSDIKTLLESSQMLIFSKFNFSGNWKVFFSKKKSIFKHLWNILGYFKSSSRWLITIMLWNWYHCIQKAGKWVFFIYWWLSFNLCNFLYFYIMLTEVYIPPSGNRAKPKLHFCSLSWNLQKFIQKIN